MRINTILTLLTALCIILSVSLGWSPLLKVLTAISASFTLFFSAKSLIGVLTHGRD